MSDKKKLFLLVDDSEIDLEVLRTMLEETFDTLEATSASEAMDYLQDPYISVDAMLLDISMPEMDGFSMLDLMEQENLPVPPVFMISSEATQTNVTKALLHRVNGFIRKPFQKDDVFRQIYKGLNLSPEAAKPASKPASAPDASKTAAEPSASVPKDPASKSASSLEETMQYITKLRSVYCQFLIQIDHDIDHYSRMVNLMLILLEQYKPQTSLEWEEIELISHAAFFVEIGRMVYPFGEGPDIRRQRALAGAELLHLNTSPNCAFFAEVSSSLCRGFYHKNSPKPAEFEGDYAPFLQMCILCERLDTIYFGYAQYTAIEFSHAVKALKNMETTIDPSMFELLFSAGAEINAFYTNQKKMSPRNWL